MKDDKLQLISVALSLVAISAVAVDYATEPVEKHIMCGEGESRTDYTGYTTRLNEFLPEQPDFVGSVLQEKNGEVDVINAKTLTAHDSCTVFSVGR